MYISIKQDDEIIENVTMVLINSFKNGMLTILPNHMDIVLNGLLMEYHTSNSCVEINKSGLFFFKNNVLEVIYD